MKRIICVFVTILVLLAIFLVTDRKGKDILNNSILDGKQCENGLCLPPEGYK